MSGIEVLTRAFIAMLVMIYDGMMISFTIFNRSTLMLHSLNVCEFANKNDYCMISCFLSLGYAHRYICTCIIRPNIASWGLIENPEPKSLDYIREWENDGLFYCIMFYEGNLLRSRNSSVLEDLFLGLSIRSARKSVPRLQSEWNNFSTNRVRQAEFYERLLHLSGFLSLKFWFWCVPM